MNFPSPVAFHLGPWPIYWYGILYVFGILLSWRYGIYALRHHRFPPLKPQDFEAFLQPLFLGVIVGGRLGDILFYRPWVLLENPVEIFYTRQGGMSFHGGLLGCLVACWLYCQWRKLPLGIFLNLLCSCAPLGLFFGRLGNFMNQELYGYPTSKPWGVVFPLVDNVPRHPSPLYEALGEGLGLFALMALLTWKGPKAHGKILSFFLLFYGIIRFSLEFFRFHSDGFLGALTTGQWYCLPMIVYGLWRLFII